MRRYIVRINGVSYKISGSFSYGAYNAFCDVIANPNNGYADYLPIPGGRNEGLNLIRFEAINHAKQTGLVAWVFSDN